MEFTHLHILFQVPDTFYPGPRDSESAKGLALSFNTNSRSFCSFKTSFSDSESFSTTSIISFCNRLFSYKTQTSSLPGFKSGGQSCGHLVSPLHQRLIPSSTHNQGRNLQMQCDWYSLPGHPQGRSCWGPTPQSPPPVLVAFPIAPSSPALNAQEGHE